MARRAKSYYDGTNVTGKMIGDLLPEILSGIAGTRGDEREALFRAWFALIGEKMAPLTEPVSFKDGVLTIKVKSATLYSLLCQHEKARLLQALQGNFSIRNLNFRIG